MYYFLLLLFITGINAVGTDKEYTDAEYAWLLQNKKAILETNAEGGDIPDSIIVLKPREVPSDIVPVPPKAFQKKAEKEQDDDFTDEEYKWLLENGKLMIEDELRENMDIPGSILIRPRRNISENVKPIPPAKFQLRAK
ncbi:hypothetical protein T4B_6639 [Trichinella pseudospiralis]|uniref:Uncharacterized protein n=1 Tax=Trichinella pseudospiralis TaxID=6337 RepID=A0A0V1JIK6_TRIPS|nr:hypothetical protein T4A_10196 [Trichinella pseudospiralis]KRZ34778.1 hypothetical protein T4B_6639 [Trichinella pseudospiralis]KRZ46409.1 hypothetical protein T4C_4663 [Trichinella pseudospiralis]